MNQKKQSAESPAAAPVPAASPSNTAPQRLLVTAPSGRVCPMEMSRDRIGQTPVAVPDNSYYRRLIADGSLVLKQEG